MLKEERVRDLLILGHTQAASDSLEADPSAKQAMAQETMENTYLVWLNNSLLLIAQKVVERITQKISPMTLFSWRRQFRQLGGYFKRDGRGVRARVDPERGRCRDGSDQLAEVPAGAQR